VVEAAHADHPLATNIGREQGIELEYEVELWRSNPEPPPTEKKE